MQVNFSGIEFLATELKFKEKMYPDPGSLNVSVKLRT